MKKPDHFLDITGDICPMTFVRTKLLLEQMVRGETVEIRLNSGEAVVNVPRSAAELGHVIVELKPEDDTIPDGVQRLVIRRT